MRNPLPVLAAALLAAVGAFATDLPTWTQQEEPFGAWRIVIFTDSAGKGHDLWCKWSECGKATTGTALLYTYTRQSSEPYTYHDGYFDFKGSQSAKTTYSTELSHFVLDLKTQKAIVPGTELKFETQGQRSFIPLGYIVRVLPPMAMANDLPAEKPLPPTEPTKPGNVPLPKPKPNPAQHPKPKPKSPVATQPGPKNPAHAAVGLSTLERSWLMPKERTVYDDATDPKKKPSAAALQTAYQKARETVARNLRDKLREPYKADVAAGDFDKVETLLTNQNYSGFEVALHPEEYEALKKVVKTADAHADFTAPNAAAQYDLEMQKPVDGQDGKPHPLKESLLKEFLLAHEITEKFRAMLPGAKPGTTPDGKPVKLTDDELAKLSPADRDAYNKAWDAAKTDDERRALNKTYNDKIAAAKPSQRGPFDPSKIKTLEGDYPIGLKSYTPAEQKQFCSALSSDAGALGACGDIAANGLDAAKFCVDKYPPVAGDKMGAANTKVSADRVACAKEINACKPQAGAKPASIPSASLPKDLRDYCATLLANSNLPDTNTNIGTGGSGSAIDQNPCPGAKAGAAPAGSPTEKVGKDVDPCPKPEDKKEDKDFYTNLGNGVALGIGGLLLASFFGGPVLMLAVAVAAGVGGYYVSKSITEPKSKDDKKK